ncbi:MAG: hypothetical protein ACRES1_01145, partial [Steroidobacteraceae bacterium]
MLKSALKVTFSAAAAAVGLLAAGMSPAHSSDTPRISEPGYYSGYSPVIYDGYQRTSFYVPVRDGTRLAVD